MIWPEAKIQRCLVHIKRNIQRATGLRPSSAMGKTLRRLSLELLKVHNLDQAADWTRKLHKLGRAFRHQLNEKTYVKDTPIEQILKTKRNNKHWWYTHYTYRGIYTQLAKLAKNQHLFTFLAEQSEGSEGTELNAPPTPLKVESTHPSKSSFTTTADYEMNTNISPAIGSSTYIHNCLTIP